MFSLPHDLSWPYVPGPRIFSCEIRQKNQANAMGFWGFCSFGNLAGGFQIQTRAHAHMIICINLCIYTYLLYICIYIYIYVCVCEYVHIYIYEYTLPE